MPVPNKQDLAELNEGLLEAAIEDELRTIHGRTETVADALPAERGRLLPLATDSFDLADVSFPVVDRQRCVLVKTNAYADSQMVLIWNALNPSFFSEKPAPEKRT